MLRRNRKIRSAFIKWVIKSDAEHFTARARMGIFYERDDVFFRHWHVIYQEVFVLLTRGTLSRCSLVERYYPFPRRYVTGEDSDNPFLNSCHFSTFAKLCSLKCLRAAIEPVCKQFMEASKRCSSRIIKKRLHDTREGTGLFFLSSLTLRACRFDARFVDEELDETTKALKDSFTITNFKLQVQPQVPWPSYSTHTVLYYCTVCKIN